MGLHKILKKLKEKEHEVRVLVLCAFTFNEQVTDTVRGLDNAGKSTIIKRFKGEDLDSVSPTYGFEIKTMMYQEYALQHLVLPSKTQRSPSQPFLHLMITSMFSIPFLALSCESSDA